MEYKSELGMVPLMPIGHSQEPLKKMTWIIPKRFCSLCKQQGLLWGPFLPGLLLLMEDGGV